MLIRGKVNGKGNTVVIRLIDHMKTIEDLPLPDLICENKKKMATIFQSTDSSLRNQQTDTNLRRRNYSKIAHINLIVQLLPR